MNYTKQILWRCMRFAAVALVLWASTLLAESAESEQDGVEAAAPKVASTVVPAEETDADKPLLVEGLDLTEAAEEDSWSVATRLGFGLALVVLLAWAAAQLLRKSTLGRQLGADNGVIRVAERAYLGPKKAVFLVEIGGRALALGVTEENINTLAEWDAGELHLEPQQIAASPFASQLKNLLGQTQTPEGEK